MVVLCPNCGREIFSDPDSCVMCGWRRDDDSQHQGRGRGMPQRERGPPPQYGGTGHNRDYRRPPPRHNPYQHEGQPYHREAPDSRYVERRGDFQRRQGGPPPDRRSQEGYPRHDGYPPQQRPPSRPYYQDERRHYPPERSQQYMPPSRYSPPPERGPPQRLSGQQRTPGRNYCPNCQREIYGDPNSCVLCGWEREAEGRRIVTQEFPQERYQEQPRREYREPQRRGPPEGWEYGPSEKDQRRAPYEGDTRPWYPSSPQARDAVEGKTRDRFVCDNCGNPSLQFFADGLGRCPGCGQRFKYSSRPTSSRAKTRHKQFICSQCDCKNLQFFLDGRGLCPQCKREFRWKK